LLSDGIAGGDSQQVSSLMRQLVEARKEAHAMQTELTFHRERNPTTATAFLRMYGTGDGVAGVSTPGRPSSYVWAGWAVFFVLRGSVFFSP
jgi:hypothetical protein